MKIMLISLLIILFLLILPLFIFFPKPPKRKDQTYDLALVLGCPCKDDGALSRMQKRRSDHALWLYRQHAYRLLIISGSCVKNKYNEAEHMMAHVLAQEDIPHECETRARNTYENFT